MSTPKLASQRLENLLSALERVILDSPVSDISMRGPQNQHATVDIRALVDARTKQDDALDQVPKRAVTVPRDISGRLKLLRKLLATRPEVSLRISPAFGGGRIPSREEIDRLTEELIRLGVLRQGTRGVARKKTK